MTPPACASPSLTVARQMPSLPVAGQMLALLDELAAEARLPRARALHLPPAPPPGGERGEFCALELDGGALGQSYVLLDDTWRRLDAAARSAAGLGVAGQPALDLARGFLSDDPLQRTVGFAAVNALTRWLFDRAGLVPPGSDDSLGGLDPHAGDTVGMIGHFAPLLPRLRERGARVVVVELRPELVRDDGQVRVTLDAAELAACRQVLATGTLLLNGTLDAMLAHCRAATHIALIGPSVGGPPDPLFERGITCLGGSWVTDPAAFVDALRRGEPTRPHARKGMLRPGDYPGWAVLRQRR